MTPQNATGVDVGKLATLLNISTRYVYKLAAIPGFPERLAPGRFDAAKSALWYLRHLQMELERRGSMTGPESAEMKAARLGLLRAQVDKISMENRVVSGELLELDVVREALTRRLINCKHRLRAIPSALGVQLTNKADPGYIVGRLTEAVNEALAELDGGLTGHSEPRRDRRRRGLI
jgi:phage terminase Nu1 subunit (DNA packaging protein)